jgi:hypothetical protein
MIEPKGEEEGAPATAAATAEPPVVPAEDLPSLQRRQCACGGFVIADPISPAKGVAAHQFTSRHRAWRANREAAE